MTNQLVKSFSLQRKLGVLLLLIVVATMVKADTLTLQKAYSLAEENYPNIKSKALFDQSTEMKLKNLTARYYPQGSVNAQFTYQSDVVQFPAQFSQFVKIEQPRDHFLANLEINQTIYDGGYVKASKQIERAQHDVDLQNLQVDLYSVRARVNTYFFTMLLMQQRHQILDSTHALLDARIKQLTAGYNNGAVLQGDILKLKAERMKVEQSAGELDMSAKTITDALSVLLGTKVKESTNFSLPNELEHAGQSTGESTLAMVRPEYKLLQLQQAKLVASKKLVSVSNMPKVAAFGQAGVAYPNQFNFVDTKVAPYYLFGAKVTWNISSWYITGREKKLIDLQKQVIDIQRENFQRNIDLAAANDNGEIRRLKNLVTKDDEIIGTYSSILKFSGNQLDNGTITVTDFLADVNAESQAKLNKQLHLVQLAQAQANYLTNVGTPDTQSK